MMTELENYIHHHFSISPDDCKKVTGLLIACLKIKFGIFIGLDKPIRNIGVGTFEWTLS